MGHGQGLQGTTLRDYTGQVWGPIKKHKVVVEAFWGGWGVCGHVLFCLWGRFREDVGIYIALTCQWGFRHGSSETWGCPSRLQGYVGRLPGHHGVPAKDSEGELLIKRRFSQFAATLFVFFVFLSFYPLPLPRLRPLPPPLSLFLSQRVLCFFFGCANMLDRKFRLRCFWKPPFVCQGKHDKYPRLGRLIS